MEDNKSELIMKRGNNLDLLNLNDKSNKDFSNIKHSKLYKKLILEKILDSIKNIQLVLLSQKSLNKAGNKIKYRPQKLCDHSLIKYITGIYDKNIIINPKLISELSDLKLLNFKLENQIEFIDTKIKLLSNNKFNEKNPYMISYQFITGKNENIEAYNSLHDNLLDIRDRFKSVVKKKNFQNNVINQLNTAINILKEERKFENKKYKNEYIITSQIINEESKDYPTKTSSFANDNYCDKEKINSNKIENDILYKGKLIYI